MSPTCDALQEYLYTVPDHDRNIFLDPRGQFGHHPHMTQYIRAVVFARNLPALLAFIRRAREQRIPITLCSVYVGTAFEPIGLDWRSSRQEEQRYAMVDHARQTLTPLNLDNDRERVVAILIREDDYALAALMLDGTMRRNWFYFLRKHMYG